MHPEALFVASRYHLDQDVTEGLAASHSADRVMVGRDRMIIAIAQGETPGVIPGIAAQVTHPADTVHGQRGFVGPENGLV
ncbi:hypothetical protein D3C84_1112040 [compost metagenome]